MIYRRLEEKDIDSVCELELRSFSMPWHRESFEDMLNNTCALFLVAEDDEGVICGYAGVLAVCGEGEICNIAVRDDRRGQGIGEQIVRKMIKIGRSEYGISDFTLEVRVSNQVARNLYEKLGFVFEGNRPKFYENPTEDAAIYWLRNS